jgi:hypothetical protein
MKSSSSIKLLARDEEGCCLPAVFIGIFFVAWGKRLAVLQTLKTMKTKLSWLAAGLLALGIAKLDAQSTINVNLDEYGTAAVWTNGAAPGTGLGSSQITDPSGGLPGYTVLVYSLGFTNMPGDVLVQDPTYSGSPILDVLRFLANGQLIVYSDNLNGLTTPGDTPGMPNPLLSNILFATKNYASSSVATAVWTPTASQPGYNPGFTQISYTFFDPGFASVPEPATTGLLAIAGGILIGVGVWRKAKTQPTSRNSLQANRELEK